MNNTSTSFTWKYIVEGMQQGDNTAFDAFYNLTYSKLKKRILFKTGFNEQDAEDLLQEVYIRVFSKINDLKDPEAAIGWTNSICDSIYLDHVKKENRRAGIANVVNESAMQSQDDDTDDFSLAMIADPDADIEALIEHQEVQKILQEIISSLPAMYRSCIELQMSDKSVKEIAQELQLNENTAKTLIRRAKMQIKDKVLDLEKRGTKLYGVAPLVFFVWVYRIWMAKSEYLPTGSAAALADMASASAAASNPDKPKPCLNNDDGADNGNPDLSKGIHTKIHHTAEPGASAEYKADITEDLKIHNELQGITEKLNTNENATGIAKTVTNASGATPGGAVPTTSSGAVSAASAAGLGTGKIIAIAVAGVILVAGITLGVLFVPRILNHNSNNNTDNIPISQNQNNSSDKNQTETIFTTDNTVVTQTTGENNPQVEVNYQIGTWYKFENDGGKFVYSKLVIKDIEDSEITFNLFIYGIYDWGNITASISDDGKAYFETGSGSAKNGKHAKGYFSLLDDTIILNISEDTDGEWILYPANPACSDVANIINEQNNPFYHKNVVVTSLEVDKETGNILSISWESTYRYSSIHSDGNYSYSYDEYGKVIERSDGKYYSYNDKGALVKEESNNTITEYNDKGEILRTGSINSYTGELDSEMIYNYENGKLISIEPRLYIDVDAGPFASSQNFEYDNLGRLSRITTFYGGTEYSYYDEGSYMRITDETDAVRLSRRIAISHYYADGSYDVIITENDNIPMDASIEEYMDNEPSCYSPNGRLYLAPDYIDDWS